MYTEFRLMNAHEASWVVLEYPSASRVLETHRKSKLYKGLGLSKN